MTELVIEPPIDYQLDSLEKLEFYPKVMRNLAHPQQAEFDFVMVTNQDGLGTTSFPEETFSQAHNLMMKTFEGEGITFDDISSRPQHARRQCTDSQAAYRNTYRNTSITRTTICPHSFVIGDRPTDVELAKNLGCRAILLQDDTASLKPVFRRWRCRL